MKRCSKCGEDKDESLFTTHNGKPHGPCKACRALYRKNNQEKIARYQKAWGDSHPGYFEAASKRRREERPEQVRSDMRAWREKNAEHVLDYSRKYREHNAVELAQRLASWKSKNKDRIREYKLRKYHEDPRRDCARVAVQRALDTHRMSRPNLCSACGENRFTEAHHWSYEREHWLDVEWLCRGCHENVHHREVAA